MRHNRFLLVLLITFFLGAFLRFYQLGDNPPSLDWDEASLGYNIYSILKTGADEYGNKLPLSIRSFDDYKPPLYVYLSVPFVAFFGLNEFSVRVVSAIAGTILILGVYFLVKELFSGHKAFHQQDNHDQFLALIAAFLIAVSPWSIQFSRAAFEGNIGLTFFIFGILFFLYGLKRKYFLILGTGCFVLSIYSYHSFRLITPLLILVIAVLFWKEFYKKISYLACSILIFFVCSIPIFQSFFVQQGTGSRLSMVTIFNPEQVLKESLKELEIDISRGDKLGQFFHNRRLVYGFAALEGYLDHFNPDFLFLHGDGGRQHHAVNMGMLYIFELPFILLGFIILFNNFNKQTLLFLLLFLLSPLPSAITTGTPHPVRAIALMPALHILTAIGALFVLYKFFFLRSVFVKFSVVILLTILFFSNFSYYLHQYYIHTPIEYGYFWQYGNKEAIEYARQHENEYRKIVMTYRIDQPYIYYLFYNKIDPVWYQKNWAEKGNIGRFERKIGKYEFRYIDFDKDSKNENTLLIGIPDEIPYSAKVIKEIRYLDGSVVYRIAKT